MDPLTGQRFSLPVPNTTPRFFATHGFLWPWLAFDMRSSDVLWYGGEITLVWWSSEVRGNKKNPSWAYEHILDYKYFYNHYHHQGL